MKQLHVCLIVLSTAMSTGTFVLAQDRGRYLGEWAGKGTFHSTDGGLEQPIMCRYLGAEKVEEMRIRLRCASRQKAQLIEMRLVYGEANQIVAAKIVRPLAQAGQNLDVVQGSAGLRISTRGGAQITLRRVRDSLNLSMIEPGHGRAEVRLESR